MSSATAKQSRQDNEFDLLARLIPDPRLVFMNHGYSEGTANELDWLVGKPKQDFTYRYSMNMVRRALRGVPTEGARMLDVGCGRGGPADYLARYARAGQVTGLDLSHGNIEFCRRRFEGTGIEFVQGDAQQQPFEAERFDVVMNIESSCYYGNIRQFFAEVHRVLVPGGTFCYTDVCEAHLPAERRRWLEAAGLVVVSSEDITEQVIEGLIRSSETLHKLFVSFADPASGNQEYVARLLNGITVGPLCAYLRRRTGYHLWQATKKA
jgi:ubiquinone/menaquinone biosynthesis C-methylase UbiE